MKQVRNYMSLADNSKTNISLLAFTHYKFVPTIELTVGDANTLARISSWLMATARNPNTIIINHWNHSKIINIAHVSKKSNKTCKILRIVILLKISNWIENYQVDMDGTRWPNPV